MEIAINLDQIINILYLLIGLFFSIFLIAKSKMRISYIVTGLVGLTIIFGDAFRLIPDILLKWNIPVIDYYQMLGVGQIVISIIMILLFVMFYWTYKAKHPNRNYSSLDVIVYALTIVKIISIIVEANLDISTGASFIVGVLKNTPFVLMGAIIIMLSYKYHPNKDQVYLFYAITLFSLYKVAIYYLNDTLFDKGEMVAFVLTTLIFIITPVIKDLVFKSHLEHRSIRKLE